MFNLFFFVVSDYKYDVVISCSSEDINWVEQKLLHGLEERSYSCCVAFRDFIPGKPVIDNIVQAIYNSRTIVVVLSPDFVKSKFCSFELEMTLLNKECFHALSIPFLCQFCIENAKYHWFYKAGIIWTGKAFTKGGIIFGKR